MSTAFRTSAACLLALASSSFLVHSVHAGVVTAPGRIQFPSLSSGEVGAFGTTPAPNNDGSTSPSPNTFSYRVFANSNDRMDVEFVLADSGGVTEYRVSQALFNLTSTPWTGFHYELGFGVGADFVRSGATDGLGFDLDSPAPAAGSPSFAQVAQALDTLDFSGGNVPGPAPAVFSFTVDVPDGLASWNPDGQARFTLRQLPVLAAVPEPATHWLLLCGLALAGARRLRRWAPAA